MATAPFTLKVRKLKVRNDSFSFSSSSYESPASSADNAPATSCRTPTPSRRHNTRASRQPSEHGVSSSRVGERSDEQ